MTKPRILDDALIGNCCTFRCADALMQTGGADEACERHLDIRSNRNAFGTLSKDRDAATGQRRGDHEQPCSMAGIINSARRPSLKREDAWCRD